MDWSLVFGMLSILFALLNVVFTFIRKDCKAFMFASLSFTILTVYAAHANDLRIINSLGFDRDLMSTHIFLDAALASIAINAVGLFGKRRKKQ